MLHVCLNANEIWLHFNEKFDFDENFSTSCTVSHLENVIKMIFLNQYVCVRLKERYAL